MIIEKINKQIEHYTLSNGLQLYIHNNAEYNRMYANYAVNYGSIDTEYKIDGKLYTDPMGIAHYLEHLMFADGDLDFFDEFSNLGANANAYTSFDQTSYIFSTSSEYHKCLQILIEMVQTLNVSKERVLDEYGVIKEEIEMYASNPNHKLVNNTFNATCTSNYQNDIAGSLESIAKIDIEDIKRLFELFYNPANCVLFLAGNFEFDIVAYIEQLQVRNDQQFKVEHIRAQEKLQVNRQCNFVYDKVASAPSAMLGIKFNLPTTSSQLIDFDIAAEVINLWLGSDINPAYTKAVQAGSLNESFSVQTILDKNINLLLLRIQSGAASEVLSYVQAQLASIDKATIEMLRRKKIGSEIKLFSHPEALSEYMLDLIVRDIDIIAYYERLYQITSTEIKAIINKFEREYVFSQQTITNNEEGIDENRNC